MQSSWCVRAIGALAVLGAGQAMAGPAAALRTEAKLVSAASAPRTETIGGVLWTCDGDTCTGAAERRANLDSPLRECKKVVAVLGPVSAYRTGPRELNQGQVRACNRAAPQGATASQ